MAARLLPGRPEFAPSFLLVRCSPGGLRACGALKLREGLDGKMSSAARACTVHSDGRAIGEQSRRKRKVPKSCFAKRTAT